MKFKIILLLFLLGISIVKVKAYTYSEWSTEFPEGYEDILIESEVRYKWYKEYEDNIEYLLKSDFGDKLYDLTDFKYSDLSEESIIKPENIEDRVITSVTRPHLFTDNDIDHILIKDTSPSSLIYFSEIDIYDKLTNTPIEYTFESVYNDKYHTDILDDNDIETYMKIESSVKISMNLGKKYNVNNLLVKIYYKAENSGYRRFTNMFTYGLYEGLVSKIIDLDLCTEGCVSNHVFDSTYTKTMMLGVPHYTYKDKLYKTYSIENEYLDEYFKEAAGYTKDEDTETVFYRYIMDKYILTDLSGNLIDRDSYYCDKNPCILKLVKKKMRYPQLQITALKYQKILLTPKHLMTLINTLLKELYLQD